MLEMTSESPKNTNALNLLNFWAWFRLVGGIVKHFVIVPQILISYITCFNLDNEGSYLILAILITKIP